MQNDAIFNCILIEVAVMSKIIDYFFDEEEKRDLVPIYIRLVLIYFLDGIIVFLIFIL